MVIGNYSLIIKYQNSIPHDIHVGRMLNKIQIASQRFDSIKHYHVFQKIDTIIDK